MKKFLSGINVAILFALALPSVAHAIGVEMAAGAWLQAPSGTLGYKALSSNDILDLENDLNYGAETRPFGRLIIDMPVFVPNIYLMYTPMEFEGDGSTSGSFKFGDQIIDGTVGYSSKLKYSAQLTAAKPGSTWTVSSANCEKSPGRLLQ